MAANAGSAADQAPSALQLRVRMLEMSPVFSELTDGAIRSVARRMRVVGLPAADKLKLGTEHGDVVVFLASGVVEQTLTDASGRILLTRRRLPGDLLILPVHRAGDRFVTSIDGIASAMLVQNGSRTRVLYGQVLLCALLLSALQGGTEKLAPPLVWTLCLAAQLSPRRLTIIAAPLRWRTFQWLGAISYPIYLANEPIQKALAFVLVRVAPGEPAIFTAVWLPAAVLIPIGVAVLLHRYVEILRWGRAIAHGGGRSGGTAIVARP